MPRQLAAAEIDQYAGPIGRGPRVHIDLTDLPQEEFVLHFGGRSHEIDAVTFSNALLGMAGALQEVNRQLHPEISMEVTIDAVGPGSFRARVRNRPSPQSGLFIDAKDIAKGVVIGVIVLLIQQAASPKTTISVSDGYVVVEDGSTKTIVPRHVWDARERLPNPSAVRRQLSKTFVALEDDPSVTDFGILRHMRDEQGLATLPRNEFGPVAHPPDDDTPPTRILDEATPLTVVKAVFQRGPRKWEFIWKGHRISAPITDSKFFDRLAAREIRLAQGDELEAVLRIHQSLDDLNRVYVNERYEVIEVHGVRHREHQPSIPGSG